MGLWEVEDWGIIANHACWSMFAVTSVVVILRIWSRVRYGRGHRALGGLGFDDAITVFCVIVMLVTCVLLTIASHYGLGRRMNTIPEEKLETTLKFNLIISAILIWTFSLPKFAIIATLKRILDYGTKTAILFWGLALTSQACILATSIWWFEQCDPVEAGWDMSVRTPTSCADTSVLANLGYFTSAYSSFLDLFFALYPIPFIMRLNMPLKNRIAVSVAMSLSSLAFIVSIYKLVIFGEVFDLLAKDLTYPIPFLDILGMAEGNILIIAASLPTLGPVFRSVKRKVRTRMGLKPRTLPSEPPLVETVGKIRIRKLRHQKFKSFLDTDLESGSATAIMPTTNNTTTMTDVPLVETGATGRNEKDIHMKFEVRVSSEALPTAQENPKSL